MPGVRFGDGGGGLCQFHPLPDPIPPLFQTLHSASKHPLTNIFPPPSQCPCAAWLLICLWPRVWMWYQQGGTGLPVSTAYWDSANWLCWPSMKIGLRCRFFLASISLLLITKNLPLMKNQNIKLSFVFCHLNPELKGQGRLGCICMSVCLPGPVQKLWRTIV